MEASREAIAVMPGQSMRREKYQVSCARRWAAKHLEVARR